MPNISSLKPKCADILIIAIIAMTASVFGGETSYLLALFIAITYLAKNALSGKWLIKQLYSVYALAIVSFSALAISFFAFLPVEEMNEYFPRTFHIERLNEDLPSMKRLGTITERGLNSKAKSKIHAEYVMRIACSENMEADYRNYLKYPAKMHEFNPWAGRKTLCSSLWMTITYVNNSKCKAYSDAIMFDSIKISNSRYAFEVIKGDSSFVGIYRSGIENQ